MNYPAFEGGLISIGQRVHCILYGGRDGIVVAIHGEQSPGTCKSLCGIMSAGGRASFDIIWDDGTQSGMIPESLLRSSVQWKVFADIASVEDILVAQGNLEIATDQRLADLTAKEIAFNEAVVQLKAANPHLVLADKEPNDTKRAAANIRIVLKTAFPKVKFSVRSARYGSINISWNDGPTIDQVDETINCFKDGHFNGMEDIYEYETTPWNKTFGGVEYLWTSRETSDSVKRKAIDDLWVLLKGNLSGIQKPDPDKVFSQYQRVPSLDVEVSELVRSLMRCWDALSGKYISSRTGHTSFIVEQACKYLTPAI